ncbi:MAG: hypothetical protein R2873_25785 [Caldilineaceae bacterium]
MSLSDLIADLRRDLFMTNVTAWQVLPPRPAKTRSPRRAALADGLRRRGIERLYLHQRQAVDAGLCGQNVAVVTPPPAARRSATT